MSVVEISISKKLRFLSVENGLLAVFIVFTAVGMWHHELWRDEAQAWLLARDSHSLLDLLHNTRHEGHPLLWHLCLFGLVKITHQPWIMQAFHGLLSVGSVVLIVKASPFSLLQKGLLSVSYFLGYEYSLISRNYALGVFLIFLFCALYTRRNPRYWLLAIVLALLANASVFGLIISFALSIVMLYRAVSEPKRLGPLGPVRQVMPQMMFLVMSWVISACQILRVLVKQGMAVSAAGAPVDLEKALIPAGGWSQINKVAKLVGLILKSYFPMPQLRIDFWNKHLLIPEAPFPPVGWLSLGLFIGIVIAAIAVILSLKILWKTPLYLSMYVAASSLLAGFHALIFRGDTRHYGHFFIVLLASLWLATWSRRRQGERHVRGHALRHAGRPARIRPAVGSAFLTTLLIFQAMAGIYAYTTDLIYPFSSSRVVSHYIQTHRLENSVLFSSDDRKVAGISAYLDRSIYYPQRVSFGSFWDIAYPELDTPQAVIDSIETFAQQQPDFLAILTHPIDPGVLTAKVVLLSEFSPTIQSDERLYLYSVQSD